MPDHFLKNLKRGGQGKHDVGPADLPDSGFDEQVLQLLGALGRPGGQGSPNGRLAQKRKILAIVVVEIPGFMRKARRTTLEHVRVKRRFGGFLGGGLDAF